LGMLPEVTSLFEAMAMFLQPSGGSGRCVTDS
jgi:hypothetical protein